MNAPLDLVAGRGRLRAFLYSSLLFLLLAPASWAVKIQQVHVRTRDGSAIDAQSVLAFIRTRAGQEYNRGQVASDVKSLEKIGRFSYVQAQVETVPGGIEVIYLVQPRKRLRILQIEGAEYLGVNKVRRLLELNRGDLIDADALSVRLNKVRDEYKEKYFPFVHIESEVVPVPGTASADVNIKVTEGNRSKVDKIGFEGNVALSNKQLKKVMIQKQRNLLSYITRAGVYNADDLETDVLRVAERYRSEGYLDVKVSPAVVEKKKDGDLDVDMRITEGPQFSVGKITVEGATLFPVERIRQGITLQPGSVASSRELEAARQAVQDYYGSRGYIRTRVAQQVIAHPTLPVVDLNFKITEGILSTIRDIEIRGNNRTKDNVIRRELNIFPGDVFDQVRIRNSANRVRNLGFFSFVNPVPEKTAREREYDLVFEVEEQKTGSFVAGAGLSSVDELIGFIELSQGNFDLLGWPNFTGAGQKIRTRLTLGTKRRDYEISFTEPWFLNRKLALGLSAYQHDSRFLSDDFDQRNTGASVSLGKPIPNTTYWRGTLQYSLERVEIRNVDEDASALIRAEEGDQWESSVGFLLRRDSRDSNRVATRGSLTRLNTKLSGGFLGFDTDLYKLEARHNHFVPLWLDHVLNFKGWMQVVEEYGDSDRVPIFDRLFLGGARTIRGFDFRDVGPKDEDGEPIGGRSSIYGTVEYTVPVASVFRAATFYDTGMISEEAYEWELGEMNSSFGFGLRIDMPGFPLQLDYSWPIETDEFNDSSSGRFSFLIGYFF